MADQNGYRSQSLIVFADNRPAMSLSKKAEFKIAGTVELQGNEIIRHQTGCLLLECKID